MDKNVASHDTVLRRGVEMNILQQPYLHRPPWPIELCDSLVTVLGECWDDTHKSRSVIKFVYWPTLTRLFFPTCRRVAASLLFFSLFVLHA